MNTVGTLHYSRQYSNTVQDKGTSMPPSTERLSSALFSSTSTNQAHGSYHTLSSRVTVKKPLRENPSGLPVGLGVEEGEEMGEKEMGEKDGTGWKGRTRDKIRGEAGKVYIPPRYIPIRYTLYAVRYTLSDR